jgi:hypothetical protein
MHPFRPTLETLEDRSVPANLTTPWADPQHLTISFVPDGTQVGGAQSNLFSVLDAVAPRDVWQHEVLRSFQSWAAPADIDIGLVADSGDAVGTGSLAQGDPRFGDIRIGAFVQSGNVFATNTPPSQYVGTSRVGDVFLNSAQLFSVGGVGGADLYTVLLDEAANVLGLPDTQDPTSGRYWAYVGPRQGISSADALDIQALYGSRAAAAAPNNDPNGTDMHVDPGHALTQAFDVQGEIARAGEADLYKLQAPDANHLSPDGVTVRLLTAGSSLLSGRLELLDRNMNTLAVLAAPAPGEDVSFQLAGVQAGGQYYLRVTGEGSDPFSVGRYTAEADFRPLSVQAGDATAHTLHKLAAHSPELVDTAASQVWLGVAGGAATVDHARQLSDDAGYLKQTHYQAAGTLSGPSGIDWYKLHSPDGPAQTPFSFATTVTLLDAGPDDSVTVSLYDHNRNLIATSAQAGPDGSYHLAGVLPKNSDDYFVQVARTGGSGSVDYLVTNEFLGQAGNNTLSSALRLNHTADSTDQSPTYGIKGNLLSASDLDDYVIKSRQVANGQPNVMTLTITSPDDAFQPAVRLFVKGAGGTYVQLATRVLVNGGGSVQVEASGVPSGVDVYVEVSGGPGKYKMSATFSDTQAAAGQALASFSLADGASSMQSLQVNRTSVTRLALASQGGAVSMLLIDGSGNLVCRLDAAAGQTVTADVGLNAGTYTVFYLSVPGSGAASCTLTSFSLDDPIGVTPVNTAATPQTGMTLATKPPAVTATPVAPTSSSTSYPVAQTTSGLVICTPAGQVAYYGNAYTTTTGTTVYYDPKRACYVQLYTAWNGL